MKGIVFDCDGVLFDTAKANAIYYTTVRSLVGLAPLTQEEEEYCFSATVQESLEKYTPQDKLSEIMEACKRTPYLETSLPHIDMEPDLPILLEKAKNADKKIGIFTNRTKAGVIDILEHFGIRHYFSNIITCDDVTPKPSPEGLFVIEQSWNIPLNRLYFVGDTMADYGAAKQTSVQFIAFRNPSAPEGKHVKSFAEIEKILGV